jgi:hypothetical protein
MTFALIRVAAGPRLGLGHVRRAETLVRALGRPCVLSVRGAGQVRGGVPVVPAAGPGATLDAVRPRVLVLDDPRQGSSHPWCVAARRQGVPVVSIHDLGLASVPSDLAIDGSIVRRGRLAARRSLRGPEFAVIATPRRRRRGGRVRRVLVSLGGGPRVTLAARLASMLHRRWPALDILVTGGEGDGDGFAWVTAPLGLAPWLARVDAAILGGGVSLYEAVAAGVPSIGLAVVAAQQPTIRGFAARGLVLDAGLASRRADGPASVVRQMDRLLADGLWRAHAAVEGPRVLDGGGAARVARAIVALVEGASRG